MFSQLTFKVLADSEAARPQQAFLRLTAVASGDAAYFR